MLHRWMSPIHLSLIAGASLDVTAQFCTPLTRDYAYESMARSSTHDRYSVLILAHNVLC